MIPKVRSGDILVIQTPITYRKINGNAEPPSKDIREQVGFDITVVDRCDNRAEDTYADVNTFSTGLILEPPKHYHIEIIEHPLLYKTGYMMVGGPRIIQPNNNEELVIPLYKFREVDDLDLPFKAATAVLRQTEYSTVVGVSAHESPVEKIIQYQPKPKSRVQQSTLQKSTIKPQSKSNNHMF